MKRFIIIGVIVVILMFFSIPSLIFTEPGDTSTAIGATDGQYELDPNDADYSDPPEEAPPGEIMEAHCLDDNVVYTEETDVYVETDTSVSDELIANGVEPLNAIAVEIIQTNATGTSDANEQDVVWDLTGDHIVSAEGQIVEDAVLALADEFLSITTDSSNPDYNPALTLEDFLKNKNLNEIEVTLDSSPLVESDGTHNHEFEATVIMKEPLIPGVTDGETDLPALPDPTSSKTVFWYILAGSFNVSFSEIDLVTETTSEMFDYVDNNDGSNTEDTDNDGEIDDHYGFSTVPYYFFWWGEGYPEFEEMQANIGASVDIDEDGDIDKEKGADLDEFEATFQVVQTIANPDYDDSGAVPDNPYNPPHIVETVIDEVVTENPENVDIDYFDSGKIVVTLKPGDDGLLSTYEDAWIPFAYKETLDSTVITPPHWVNGEPGIAIPAGFYFINEEWTFIGAWTWYRDPIDQRFCISSYNEPSAVASTNYPAWGEFDLTKLDSETEEPIAGTQFTLTYYSGQTFTPDPSVYYLTTDSNGYANVPTNIPWGTWILDETAPTSGYLGNTDTPKYIVIGANYVYFYDYAEGVTLQVSETLTNDREGCIKITKELIGDISLATGTFEFAVWDNPDRSETPVATGSISFTNGIPDTEPYVTVCGLIYGKAYYVEETGGPGINVTPGMVNGLLEVYPCERISDNVEQIDCGVTFINDPSSGDGDADADGDGDGDADGDGGG